MTERNYPGEFEQMVLLAALRIGTDAYAVPIRREIEERADRAVARGALYTSLERLEAKGYLASRMGDPTPKRGGRSRRYYQVTPAGVSAVRNAREAMDRLAQGLDSVIGKAQ